MEASSPSGAAQGAPRDRFGLVGTRLAGRVDVERVVAEGGFGVVYAGRHVALDIPVAVKVLKLPEDFSEGAREVLFQRFQQEARTIARLRHPAVVRVLDHGHAPMPAGGDAPWMVLEWLEGETLEAVFSRPIEARERRPAAALARLRPVFEALAEAHGAGVAHRDVKPGNIMLVDSARGPVARLMDFGIAKAMRGDEAAASTGATATRSEMVTFSPAYAAPEQVAGARTGPWTDVHALALLLGQALTGRAPFAGDDLTAVYLAVLSPTRPTPARHGVDVGAWEPVLAKALALRPDARHRDAGALLAELDAALADDLPAALPATVHADVPARREGPRAARLLAAVAVTVATLVLAAAFAREQRSSGRSQGVVRALPSHAPPQVAVPAVTTSPLPVAAPPPNVAAPPLRPPQTAPPPPVSLVGRPRRGAAPPHNRQRPVAREIPGAGVPVE